MKKLIIIACSLITALAAHAQGTVSFNNRVTASGINAPILKPNGLGVSGTEGFAALYGGASEASMVLLGSPVNFRTGAAAGFVLATDTTRVVPGVVGGQSAFFQVKAWLGNAASYELATDRGNSTVFSAKTGGIIDPGTGLASTPADLVGLQGFTIPEPSTLALAGFGVAALLMRRRK